MGLFDELLKKPNPTPATDASSASGSSQQSYGSTGGNPPIIDPLATAVPAIKIEKSEEVAIATESPLDTAPAEPPPVSAVAVDDVSSILISSTPAPAVMDIGTIAPPVSGSISIAQAPATQDVSTLTEPVDTIISGSSGDSLLVSSLTTVTPEPSIVTSLDSLTPPAVESLEPNLDNLFGTANMDTTEASIIESSSLVEGISATPVTSSILEDSTEGFVFGSESSSDESVEVSSQEEVVPVYEHPSDFIQSSIAKIDEMVSRIDIAHTAKLEEALGYKTEKEKYTTLEEQAYADAEKYVREKEHALTMRSYFEEQGKIDSLSQSTVKESVVPTPIASVETTLTGLAVQNAVTDAVEPQKKSKLKKEEESLGILGL